MVSQSLWRYAGNVASMLCWLWVHFQRERRQTTIPTAGAVYAWNRAELSLGMSCAWTYQTKTAEKPGAIQKNQSNVETEVQSC